MNKSAAYDALQKELSEIESKTGITLSDEIADQENAIDGGAKYGTAEYWEAMIASAEMAAGMRAAEAGRNINNLIGRVIY